MATLTKVVTGMEGGPEAIQANFDALNEQLTAQDVTGTDDWLTTGVTLVNGAKTASGGWYGYRELRLGANWKIAQFSAQLTNVTQSGVALVQLPKALFMGHTLNFVSPASGTQVLRWALSRDALSLAGGSKPNSATDWVSVFVSALVYVGD